MQRRETHIPPDQRLLERCFWGSSNNEYRFRIRDLIGEGFATVNKADLVNALKSKIQDFSKLAQVLDSLPDSTRERVEVLRDLQSQHGALEAKFFEEKAALETKYQKLYQPLYTKRYEIVSGAEVEGGAGDTDSEDKGVPGFWLNAMKNNKDLTEEISERDKEVLMFLQDIKWSRVDDIKGFKLEFYFDTNPFFKNSVLTKTYHMIDEVEPILEKAIGTDIEWLPGKCLTHKILQKKRKKGSKNAKPITRTEKCNSFFNFFNPPGVPDENYDIDVDHADEVQNLMKRDYDIGTAIREKIIPHAVSLFTGEAAEDEYGDIEYDDEDEDEDESKTRKKKRVKTPAAADGQLDERPPDCKQQ